MYSGISQVLYQRIDQSIKILTGLRGLGDKNQDKSTSERVAFWEALSRLPLCTGAQFPADSVPAFKNRIKIPKMEERDCFPVFGLARLTGRILLSVHMRNFNPIDRDEIQGTKSKMVEQ